MSSPSSNRGREEGVHIFHQIQKGKQMEKVLCILSLALLCFRADVSMAVDAEPRDYVPLPPGTNLSAVYFQHLEASKFLSQGKEVPGDNKLEVNVPIYRFVHYANFLGMTIDPQFIIPVYGTVHAKIGALGLNQTTTSMGDLLIGCTFWFVNKPEKSFYVGFTPWFNFPTANFDHNKFVSSSALASNRYTFTPQFGVEKGLGYGFHIGGVVEGSFYTDNKNWMSSIGTKATQSKDPTFLSQIMLSYDITPTTFASIKWRYLAFGDTKVGGVAQKDGADDHRVELGLFHMITKTDQLMIEYQKVVQVRNGYDSDGFMARWVHVF